MSGRHTYTADRLAALAEAYGADPARWPAAEREAAQGLAQGGGTLGRSLEEAGRIDRLLDAAPPPPTASAALTGRIMAAAPQPRGARIRLALGVVLRPVTGLAVAAMLGVLVGALAPAPVGLTDTETTAETEISSLIAANVTLDLDADQ